MTNSKLSYLLSWLFLISFMPVLATPQQDESDNSQSKRRRLELYDSNRGEFACLPEELTVILFSHLPFKDQINIRGVSRPLKTIIDDYIWPKQSLTVKGKRLSSIIDLIKPLPFQSLNLFDCGKWKSKDIQDLSLLTKLTALNLDGNKIGKDGAESLSNLIGLTSLNVNYNEIGEEGTEALTALPSLTTLYLAGNLKEVEDTVVLTKLTSLISLR